MKRRSGRFKVEAAVASIPLGLKADALSEFQTLQRVSVNKLRLDCFKGRFTIDSVDWVALTAVTQLADELTDLGGRSGAETVGMRRCLAQIAV